MIRKIWMYAQLFFSSPYDRPKIYTKYLGIKFGTKVRILHYPRWGSEPFLIEIGDNVTITRGVSFVNHDGGVALFRDKIPGMNVFGKIKIGNNVFIGINTTVLPNVTVGNNVVIGAGSMVNKDIPDNVVVAGVPAKIVKSIDEYKESSLEKSMIITSIEYTQRKKEILEKLGSN